MQIRAWSDNIRGDEEVADTVSQHMLNDKTGLMDEKWLGRTKKRGCVSILDTFHHRLSLLMVADMFRRCCTSTVR